MSEPRAEISSGRRIPAIWLVPVVALVLGTWMVVYTYMTKGPQITIVFPTAEGIEAGKTKIRSLNLETGLVEDIHLNDDLKSVSVLARLDRDVTPLLRDDTRFWVVRPRFRMGGISGLGTIMSGAYIELEPGSGAPTDRREFVGLGDLPVTPLDVPGLSITLLSTRARSVSVGNPVLYSGFRVGTVEDTELDLETGQVRHRAFIQFPYDQLVNEETRFWNSSGVSVRASAEGMKIELGSIETLLSGGVAFGVPEGKEPGAAVEDGAEFVLHLDRQSAREEIFEYGLEYVVSFEQSIRGLLPGAPVEHRGVRVGHVEQILLDEWGRETPAEPGDAPLIPVLIRIEPQRLRLGDDEEGMTILKRDVEDSVQRGLRASLETGSLITGSLFVELDVYEDLPPGRIGRYEGYTTLPTRTGGLEHIQRQISQLLAKLNDLELEQSVAELNGLLADVRAAVAREEFQELPAALRESLRKLDRAVQGIDELARTLNEQPNSLIFSRPTGPDPEPRSQP